MSGRTPHSEQRDDSAAASRGRDGDSDRSVDSPGREPPVQALHGAVGNQAVQRSVAEGTVQPKLAVSDADDEHEREAQRVADTVVRASVSRRRSAPGGGGSGRAGGDGSGVAVDTDTERAIRAARRGGRPLEAPVREEFEARFDRDFGDVRVHTDAAADRAAREIDARAFTASSDVVFREGEYDPDSPRGKRLLAHELAHVVQQGAARERHGHDGSGRGHDGSGRSDGRRVDGRERSRESTPVDLARLRSPAVQRREYPSDTDRSTLGEGDWTTADRENATDQWESANLYNLQHGRKEEYQLPDQRRDFYLWYYNYMVGGSQGNEVRWPLAAFLVARGAAQLTTGTGSGTGIYNPVQMMALRGNQVIFDDIFPKLRALAQTPGAVVGQAAREWDAKALAEEQLLVEAMYKDESVPDWAKETFAKMSKQEDFRAWMGYWACQARPQAGPFHEKQDMPPLKGDIQKPENRYEYGMQLAAQFSTLDVAGQTPSFEQAKAMVEAEYKTDERFEAVDRKQRLHEIDAQLDDWDADEARLLELLRNLNRVEQQQFGKSYRRVEWIRDTVSLDRLADAVADLDHLPAETEQRLTRRDTEMQMDPMDSPSYF
jgi:hypothetical protein